MELSVVIPAFCEARKIGKDVTAAGRFLVEAGLSGEVIVVDDGSLDATAETAEAAPLPPGIERQTLHFKKNRGKGAAVRSGMMASRGRFAMFADSGLCVPFENALRGFELLRRGECELAHGSRWLPDSRIAHPRRLYRRILSRTFRAVVPWLAGIHFPVTDTQCGFKLYRGDVARTLYGECVLDGFCSDVEVILRAQEHGFRFREFPVDWTHDPDSRFPAVFGPLHCALELVRLKMVLRRGACSEHRARPGGCDD